MSPEITQLFLELAKTAPATVVLAFVAYRLDTRLQSIGDKVDNVLNKLADAALTKEH